MQHLIFILFFFALGACVGSFLNVVVWRLPRGESLISPPSHCPRCGHGLAWYDNIPVLGWLMLRGRCRYCAGPISPRYPTIEFLAGALFVFYYVMFFVYHIGPCAPQKLAAGFDLFGRPIFEQRVPASILTDWPIYLLSVFLISSLLAVSLIDIDSFFIPLQLPWLMAAVGLFAHAVIDGPTVPGALNLGRDGFAAAVAAGGGVGLLVSIALWRIGWIPQAFPQGEPALEVDEELFAREEAAARAENRPLPVRPPVFTPAQIRREMRKEMLFLLPPLAGALIGLAAVWFAPGIQSAWRGLMDYHWLTGLLGSLLGALVGAFVIWFARILGTLIMGRVAMGLGDMHLLFGIGAIIGAGPVTVAFFLAPFAGLVIGLYLFLARRQRELPYGPYLSLASAAVLLVYCPIADYLAPGLQGLLSLLAR